MRRQEALRKLTTEKMTPCPAEKITGQDYPNNTFVINNDIQAFYV